MSTVREMLETRRSAIEAELKPLIKEQNVRRQKLREIDIQLGQLHDELVQIEHALQSINEAQSPRLTIMDAILQTLDHKPLGMTAQEILQDLNTNYFGGKLMRHSLSPQLSRLKNRDKKIEFRNDRWIKLPDQPSLFTRRPLKD